MKGSSNHDGGCGSDYCEGCGGSCESRYLPKFGDGLGVLRLRSSWKERYHKKVPSYRPSRHRIRRKCYLHQSHFGLITGDPTTMSNYTYRPNAGTTHITYTVMLQAIQMDMRGANMIGGSKHANILQELLRGYSRPPHQAIPIVDFYRRSRTDVNLLISLDEFASISPGEDLEPVVMDGVLGQINHHATAATIKKCVSSRHVHIHQLYKEIFRLTLRSDSITRVIIPMRRNLWKHGSFGMEPSLVRPDWQGFMGMLSVRMLRYTSRSKPTITDTHLQNIVRLTRFAIR